MAAFPLEELVYEAWCGGVRVQVFDRLDRRELRFGNEVVQGALCLSSPEFLPLAYTRAMMGAFLLRPDASAVLQLGLGAGATARFIHRHFPKAAQVAVEVNEAGVHCARAHFGLPDDERLRVVVGDALSVAPRLEGRFDLIFLDAYLAAGAPPGTDRPEFLSALRGRLADGGWLAANVWTHRAPLERQVEEWRRVFDAVLLARVQPLGNAILFGSRAAAAPERDTLRRRAAALGAAIPLDFGRLLADLQPR